VADGSALVVGAGPNGLAAAITLARAGVETRVLERAASIGGGVRSEELTLPGFVHDVCSAIHPLAVVSPFFAEAALHEFGLEWLESPAPLAHPLDDGSAVVLERSVAATADGLGIDADAYRRAFAPLVRDWNLLRDELLGPLVHLPRHPLALTRFGLRALFPAAAVARRLFDGARARALFAGIAAHSILPLEAAGSGAFGFLLATVAHAEGWPFPRGGSQRIADALAARLASLGGQVQTEQEVTSLDGLTESLVLCDISPRAFVRLAGARLADTRFRRQLLRFRHGPGAFKVDWALEGPIPWKAVECARAATVHVGGTLEEIAASERAAWRGETSNAPFVLVTQPSLFDDTRAPGGRQTAWAYCHVPNGSTRDMAETIERQVERFAPGFRDRILARHVAGPAELEARNPNLVGGDISGGAQTLRQLVGRPTLSFTPYRTPLHGVYLCSSSTPPGAGVHGMCGYLAARAALRA
jgi:phytoene dehydrogenase-like protein